MKKLFILSLLIFSLLSCTSDDDSVTTTHDYVKDKGTKILTLGASRVAGNPTSHESFRYPLWKKLIEGGYSFDYIGTENDTHTYPNFSNLNFDTDHQGISGWTSSQILASLSSDLEKIESPDIVLFSSPGGNDLLANGDYEIVIKNIKAIIETLQSNNSNVTIIIEKLAPGNSLIMVRYSEEFEKITNDVEKIAIEQTTVTSKVMTIDMADGFDQANYLADPIHYNSAGAEFIASKYYEVITPLLEN